MKSGRLKYWYYFLSFILFIILNVVFSPVKKLNPAITDGSYIVVYTTLHFLLYAISGGVMGLEHLLMESKKEGKWTICFLKLFIWGIPSFIIGFYAIIYYVLPIYGYPIWLSPNLYSFIYCDFLVLQTVMQVLFGYTVITSFYKK